MKELDRLQFERYIKNGENTENKNSKNKTIINKINIEQKLIQMEKI